MASFLAVKASCIFLGMSKRAHERLSVADSAVFATTRPGFGLNTIADKMTTLAAAETAGILPRVSVIAIVRMLIAYTSKVSSTSFSFGERILEIRHFVLAVVKLATQSLSTK